MDGLERGTALILVGAVLIAGTVGVSAALAPDLSDRADGQQRDMGDGRQRATLVGSQGGGPGWHEFGSVYLLDGSTETWREDSAGSYFDVTQLDNGSVMAGFMNAGVERGCGPYEPPCARTGFRIIDPDAEGGPAVVSEYSFPVRSASNSEVHDVERLDSGEYLMTDMDAERVFTVRDGAVTWQWNASSFYNAPEDPTRRDWLHINDVDAINGTHYLVSVRNANQLVVVERGVGVVAVINEDTDDSNDENCRAFDSQLVPDADGDVRCGDPAVLNHQHNPQWLDGGAVLVADSDNDRVVELHRTDAGEWEPVWTLTKAGAELNWPRDADRLPNGHTLVTDTLNKRIFEINRSGAVVWSVRTERIPYEAERLPEGETVGGARITELSAGNGSEGDAEATRGDRPATPSGDVPVLSTGMTVLRAAVPATPFWFTELQLGLSVVGLLMVLGGGADTLRRR